MNTVPTWRDIAIKHSDDLVHFCYFNIAAAQQLQIWQALSRKL